jgi:formylglycine-generating enzyme required for sulfatase activity
VASRVEGALRALGGATLALLAVLACTPSKASAQRIASASVGQVAVDTIPGTLVAFEVVLVPGGRVTVQSGTREVEVTVGLLWVGRTEVTWDMYDAFVLSSLDEDRAAGVDAVARPSRPYGAPDYGWGHAGFPAISIARSGAEAYCAWLSARTGKRYRLPTEAEWVHVATLAASGANPARVDSMAWHAGNSGGRTHRAGSRAPDALGLHDLFGNAAEWVITGTGRPATRGGSFRDPPGIVGPAARAEQSDAWNERDPQIPPSRWWLSDAPFAGFRIVREP